MLNISTMMWKKYLHKIFEKHIQYRFKIVLKFLINNSYQTIQLHLQQILCEFF